MTRLGRLAVTIIAAALLCVASSAVAGSQLTAEKAALSTASPLATKVGLGVLQRGGNAADAAVAVALALAVVHPHAGNLGGGGFLVYYDAAGRAVWTLDFRETASRAATRQAFAKLPPSAITGALAAGVPGTVAGLEALHEKFGSRPWKELVEPSILLARDGLRIDDALAAEIAAAKRDRQLDVLGGAKAGDTVPQSELLATLQRLADAGARDFYAGELAKKIVAAVRDTGGTIGFRDLRGYKPLWRAPIQLGYGAYDIYTVPPPSGGGIVIGEALNILGDELAESGFQSVASVHLMIEAQRRAQIDRQRYVGDPSGSRIPYRELLSAKRAEEWRKTIQSDRVTATVNLAEPRHLTAEGEHTTHFTIADAEGNVVSLTTTLGRAFGSGVRLPGLGFFLNDAMTDFTSGINSADALKRPASPLSPVIVLREGKPFLAIGTSGGAAIPTTILQVFLNVVVYGKSLAEAVDAPRYHHAATPDELVYERGRAPRKLIDALNTMGHGVAARDAIGDVHAILFDGGRMVAVADPRGVGAA